MSEDKVIGKGIFAIILALNLAVLGYSAYYFLGRAGFSWNLWLEKSVTVVPLALFTLTIVSRSLFLLNLSFPFLIYYGFFYQVKPYGAFGLSIIQLSLLLVLVDIIYGIFVNIKLKLFWHSFLGLLGGFLLLLIYHRIQFGADIRVDLPVLKVYKGMVDTAEKIF